MSTTEYNGDSLYDQIIEACNIRYNQVKSTLRAIIYEGKWKDYKTLVYLHDVMEKAGMTSNEQDKVMDELNDAPEPNKEQSPIDFKKIVEYIKETGQWFAKEFEIADAEIAAAYGENGTKYTDVRTLLNIYDTYKRDDNKLYNALLGTALVSMCPAIYTIRGCISLGRKLFAPKGTAEQTKAQMKDDDISRTNRYLSRIVRKSENVEAQAKKVSEEKFEQSGIEIDSTKEKLELVQGSKIENQLRAAIEALEEIRNARTLDGQFDSQRQIEDVLMYEDVLIKAEEAGKLSEEDKKVLEVIKGIRSSSIEVNKYLAALRVSEYARDYGTEITQVTQELLNIRGLDKDKRNQQMYDNLRAIVIKRIEISEKISIMDTILKADRSMQELRTAAEKMLSFDKEQTQEDRNQTRENDEQDLGEH